MAAVPRVCDWDPAGLGSNRVFSTFVSDTSGEDKLWVIPTLVGESPTARSYAYAERAHGRVCHAASVSKAFTKDEGTSDEPIVVPARAPLPAGTANYMTARGLVALREELKRVGSHGALDPSDPRARAFAAARAAELRDRIASAVVVDPSGQTHDEVRFGALVTLRADGVAARSYQIVGVDEADAVHGRIAFVAPLARALLGKRVGELAVVRTPHGDEELEIVAIAYGEG